MTSPSLFRLAGCSAYVGAAATIVVLSSYPLAFGHVISWTSSVTTRDLYRIVVPISMVPIAVAIDRLHRGDARTMSLSALAVGITGMLALASVWTVQAVRPLSHEVRWPELQVETAAGLAIGFWFLLVSYLVYWRRRWPTDLAWLAVIAGTGFIVQMLMTYLYFSSVPPPPPGVSGVRLVAGLASIIAASWWVISYPVWAIWLGRRLLARTATGYGEMA
ncbi:MAG: hypothetical protein ACE5IB_01265 [Candidatus Geothermarchaeales archaeon]